MTSVSNEQLPNEDAVTRLVREVFDEHPHEDLNPILLLERGSNTISIRELPSGGDVFENLILEILLMRDFKIITLAAEVVIRGLISEIDTCLPEDLMSQEHSLALHLVSKLEEPVQDLYPIILYEDGIAKGFGDGEHPAVDNVWVSVSNSVDYIDPNCELESNRDKKVFTCRSIIFVAQKVAG